MARRTAPTIERPTLDYLAHWGPNRVAVGDLGIAGMPGLIYTPSAGHDLPVVALAHGWLQPVSRYVDTLRFLASWGIVAVAPATENGPFPSFGGLAVDLSKALRIAAHARLGGGRVRADPSKMGVLGHSTGGGAAVLAASQDESIDAVVTVTAVDVKPSSIEAAGLCEMPSLHITGNDGGEMVETGGAALAANWTGPTQLRLIKGGGHLGFAEGKHWTSTVSGSSSEHKTQSVSRMLAAAFFLRHLDGHEHLADELDGKIARTTLKDPHEEVE
ncbi:hypothetical protein JL107_18495 [Nakamurella flavida]|uniref:Alpha/beta hydrolase n=1 Tax=Nakamurella flavida TaxID=363630 RepID=A0A938YS31_9ACTN|nr:hypothetical protein [Nakamurella flavida]MBM9475896.1 hypothetical protein [Nakamurella flavida]MBM9478444.1 hypothetical protein [Nakamurella flavida]MDP9777818.1 dienelactone hydrolase [Nakamurella flavida]